MEQEVERKLVERCLKKDLGAWDEFFDAYYGTIRKVATRFLWEDEVHDRDDVVQEIVAQVIKSLETFKFQSSLETYVFSIALNTCKAWVRSKSAQKRGSRVRFVPYDTVDSCPPEGGDFLVTSRTASPEQTLLHKEQLERTWKGLKNLNELCRELIRLRFFEEMPFAEIAAQLKTKKNTLIKRLARCLDRLRQSLGKEA